MKHLVPLTLCFLCGLPLSAASATSVNATAGTNTCSSADPVTSNCQASFAGLTQTATASAYAKAGWSSSGSGSLEATANDFGPGTTSNASVSWSLPLLVTGGSGAGTLQLTFTGFYMNIVNSVGGASVTQPLLTVGGYSTNLTNVPNGGPGTFSVSVPIAFNTVLPFSLSFQATATGTFFMGGIYALNGSDQIVNFPAFTVANATGVPLPGATVSFVPEPATPGLMFAAAGALWIARRRRSRGRV